MLTCHEFTRCGHGLKHIEQYFMELPQMYEKTLGDSSVHCLRPCWHWSVVLSFFYFASSWFLKLVDTHCFGAWRKSQTSCLVSKVVLWCFLQYSAVSRDAQLCCLTHSTICTTVHGFAPIALLGKTFASYEMETSEYAISQSLGLRSQQGHLRFFLWASKVSLLLPLATKSCSDACVTISQRMGR